MQPMTEWPDQIPYSDGFVTNLARRECNITRFHQFRVFDRREMAVAPERICACRHLTLTRRVVAVGASHLLAFSSRGDANVRASPLLSDSNAGDPRQPFSSRLSSLKKRQSVPSARILLGVALIRPASRSRSE